MQTLSLAIALLLAPAAHASDVSDGYYRTLDGYFVEVLNDDFCLYRNLESYAADPSSPSAENTDRIEYSDLEKLNFIGYCRASPHTDYPPRFAKMMQAQTTREPQRRAADSLAKVVERAKLANSSKSCRYFVATDRLTPLTNNNSFDDLVVWLVDENRRHSIGDLWNWDDVQKIVRNLKSNDRAPRSTLSITSDWTELLPQDGEAPLFSFYVFHRLYSYNLSSFKATGIDPTGWIDYQPAQILPGFKGRQEISRRIATRQYFSLRFQVLRLCSQDNEELFPVKPWVLPSRKR